MNIEYQIKEITKNEIDVEKSKFIAIIFPCNNKEDFNDFLKKTKKEYLKARHYCYAYKFDEVIKYSDDGEPQGTAGKPILNVLLNENLNNVGLIVIRYFGGTLLGSGRLLRTYVLSASEVAKKVKKFQIIEEILYTIEIAIDSFDIFKNYLAKKQFNIVNVEFNDRIEVSFYVPLNFDENIESVFFNKLKIISRSVVKHEKEKNNG